MKKTKFEFSEIFTTHKNLGLIAANVAQIEADIVIAERHYKDAQRDDGISNPEAIYIRTEAARRSLEIRRIEANRAAAKFTEAEEEFGDLILSCAPVVLECLESLYSAESDRIKKQALSLFGAGAMETRELNTLIAEVTSVKRPSDVAHRIRMCLQTQSGNAGPSPDLITNILSAESFL